MDVLQHTVGDGQPKDQGELFLLRKAGHRTAVCKLFSHQLGWECRLMVRGELVQSQVCRTQDEVLSTGEQWKAALIERGWSAGAAIEGAAPS
jgi:hypothetical protein